MQGNFFLSEGKTGKVIKVSAAEYYTAVNYIDVIQETLVNNHSWLLHLQNPSFIGKNQFTVKSVFTYNLRIYRRAAAQIKKQILSQ